MVSWRVPSARVTVPTWSAEMPFSVGRPSVNAGGQICAHLPSQLDFGGFGVSLSNRYSTKPAPSVTACPMRGRVLASSVSVSLGDGSGALALGVAEGAAGGVSLAYAGPGALTD